VAERLPGPRKRAKSGKPSAWLRLKLDWSCGREAEGGGLLNRYRVVKPYRGFESLRLRHSPRKALVFSGLRGIFPEFFPGLPETGPLTIPDTLRYWND
jgi:hypothetical protein